jgi:peptide/nickel transport system permease protein
VTAASGMPDEARVAISAALVSKRASDGLPGSSRAAFAHVRNSSAGLCGLALILTLVLVSLFAEFLASPLPLFGRVHGQVYVLANVSKPPALMALPRAELEAELARGFSLRAPVEYAPSEQSPEKLLHPLAGVRHPLGTDVAGRDIFSILVHGTRQELTFAILAVFFLVLLGTVLGALAGFFGGATDALLSRAVETMTAFPTVVIVLSAQALVSKATSLSLLLAIALTRWAEVARIVRAEVIQVSEQDYVAAARAVGASPLRVLLRHVWPNARAQVLVAATLSLATVVLVQASCDFLNVGPDLGFPSWGQLLAQARTHPDAWWLLAFPSLAILATVVAPYLIGERLRDALDPRVLGHGPRKRQPFDA